MDLTKEFNELKSKLEEQTLLLKSILEKETVVKDKKEFYNLKETAEILQCSMPHITNLRRRGELVATVKGGKVFVKQAEIDRYMAQGAQFATARNKKQTLRKVQN